MNQKFSIRRTQNEIKHFSELDHIWWGAKTVAGQKRYDYKFHELKRYCNPRRNYKILEIGCGDGEFTRRLAKLQCKITATDITPKLIMRGKTLLWKKNVSFQVDNAEKMKFNKESFDIVCGISILHHINYKKAIKEIHRVLKSGGQLFFTEPNLINPIIFAGLKIKFLRTRMEFSPDETALVRWKMEKILKDSGFKHFNVINYDFIHPSISAKFLPKIKRVGQLLEQTPFVKEFSGSLILWAKK